MKTPVRTQAEQVHGLMDTEEVDRSLQLFTGEMYNSLTKVGSAEMIQ